MMIRILTHLLDLRDATETIETTTIVDIVRKTIDVHDVTITTNMPIETGVTGTAIE